MSVLLLHCSTVAVDPCRNRGAVLSVPAHCRLWETSDTAGQGDILPYVSCHVNRCLGEQWARCVGKSEFSLCKF